MNQTTRRWLFRVARNPAPVLLLLVVLAALSAAVSEPLALVVLVIAFVTLLQFLRVSWRRSQLVTVLISVVLPAYVLWLIPSSSRHASHYLMFLPAILSTFIELLSRRVGGFLKTDDLPASPPPPTAGQGCRNLAILLGLFFAFCTVFFVWALNAPAREANAFKERVQPGMKLSEVVVMSFDTGRHLVLVNAEDGAPVLRVGGTSVSVADESAVTVDDVRALLDRRAPELRVKSLLFMFQSAIPARSSIVVHFGPDGKVISVEGPFNRAA
jgi:hypothetical protein